MLLFIFIMSGISGIIGDVENIEHSLVSMLRCGTNCESRSRGVWVGHMAGLRLGLAYSGKSQSELTEDVHQPFVDEALQLVVVMAGEIYNYRSLRSLLEGFYAFATESTVELLSKAFYHWGEGCLTRLEGAFVWSIYDRRNGRVYVARDRFGIKPLYYATRRGNIYFASEVRSLFAVGVESTLSVERWAGYMLYSTYGPVHTTFWEEVHQLPAGSMIVYDGRTLEEKQWYNLHEDILELVVDYDRWQLESMFMNTLEQATEQSLSDLSYCGLRITGRVESQLLYYLASKGRYAWKVHPFTGDIDMVGKQPTATPVWITAERVVDELEQMPKWVEEPFDGSETLLRTVMFRHAHRDGVEVVCSGLGLDVLWQSQWDTSERRYNYLSRHAIFSPPFAQSAVRPEYRHRFSNEDDNMRYLELFYERVPHILRTFDRSASETGIAIRMPFLNSRLVALSFAMPMVCCKERSALFGHCVHNKYKLAIERVESQSLLAQWMSGGMKEWVGDAMSDLRRGALREWFDARQLDYLWQDFSDGSLDDLSLLWKCLSLHRQYTIAT